MKSRVLSSLVAFLMIFNAGQGLVFGMDTPKEADKLGGSTSCTDSKELLNQRLYAAVITNNVNEARVCIAEGAEVNHVSAVGDTPLAAAVCDWERSRDMIELLLQNGADPNQEFNLFCRPKVTPYIFFDESARHVEESAASGTGVSRAPLIAEIRAIFIKYEAVLNYHIQKELNDSLYNAVSMNHVDEARDLIHLGAHINHVFENGYTVLVEAIMCWPHSQDMIKMLLEEGADDSLPLKIWGFRPNITAREILQEVIDNSVDPSLRGWSFKEHK